MHYKELWIREKIDGGILKSRHSFLDSSLKCKRELNCSLMRNLHKGLSRPKPNPKEIPMRHFKQIQFEERFIMQKMIYSNKPVKETAELHSPGRAI